MTGDRNSLILFLIAALTLSSNRLAADPPRPAAEGKYKVQMRPSAEPPPECRKSLNLDFSLEVKIDTTQPAMGIRGVIPFQSATLVLNRLPDAGGNISYQGEITSNIWLFFIPFKRRYEVDLRGKITPHQSKLKVFYRLQGTVQDNNGAWVPWCWWVSDITLERKP